MTSLRKILLVASITENSPYNNSSWLMAGNRPSLWNWKVIEWETKEEVYNPKPRYSLVHHLLDCTKLKTSNKKNEDFNSHESLLGFLANKILFILGMLLVWEIYTVEYGQLKHKLVMDVAQFLFICSCKACELQNCKSSFTLLSPNKDKNTHWNYANLLRFIFFLVIFNLMSLLLLCFSW